MKQEKETMQDKTGRLVSNEVYACVTGMTEFILSQSYENGDTPFTWDDITNSMPDFASMDECDLDEYQEDYYGDVDFPDFDLDEKIEWLQDNYQSSEIMEWWMVSGWLAQKLADMNESVILGDNIWGRKTHGQAIKMDGVIHRLIVDLKW